MHNFPLFKGNPASLRGVAEVTKILLMQADTTTIRAILALASFFFFIALSLPGVDVKAFPSMTLMSQMAPTWLWSLAFLLHFAGLSWRFLDPVPRVRCSVVINSCGFLLWFMPTVSVNLAYGTFAPGTSAEVALCLFSAWTLIRTGSNKEILSP
jgi:hypothetical protein